RRDEPQGGVEGGRPRLWGSGKGYRPSSQQEHHTERPRRADTAIALQPRPFFCPEAIPEKISPVERRPNRTHLQTLPPLRRVYASGGRCRRVWQLVKRCGRNPEIKVGVTRIHFVDIAGARRLDSSSRRRTSCAAPAPLLRIGTSLIRLPAA